MIGYCIDSQVTNDCVILQTIFCDVIWDLAHIIANNNYYGMDSETLWRAVYLVCKHDNKKHEAGLTLKRYFHMYENGETKQFIDSVWYMSPFKYIFNAYYKRSHGQGRYTKNKSLIVELKEKWSMDDIKQILIYAKNN